MQIIINLKNKDLMTSLKEINGRYYISAKVVMFPTKAATHIKSFKNGMLYGDFKKCWIRMDELFQHLYFTSDEEIKENDWVLRGVKTIQQINSLNAYSNTGCITLGFAQKYCKKIIATTDKSLGLPELSYSFIQKYIEEYNKGNIITDVLVEYDKVMTTFLDRLVPLIDGKDMYGTSCKYKLVLKRKPDNTIIVNKVKDSWNREEHIQDLERVLELGMNIRQNQITGDCDKSGKELLKEWIKENL